MTDTAPTINLGDLFDQATRVVARVETLPAYDVDDDRESFDAWRLGLPRPERSLRTSRYLQRVAAAVARGVTWERLRVIDTPPTAYQQWELLAYVEGQAVGEQVTIAERPDVAPRDLGDFWVVDDHIIGIDYDPDGGFHGFYDLGGAREQYMALRDTDLIRYAGVPLNTYLAAAPAARRAS